MACREFLVRVAFLTKLVYHKESRIYLYIVVPVFNVNNFINADPTCLTIYL